MILKKQTWQYSGVDIVSRKYAQFSHAWSSCSQLSGKFFETGDDGGRINECFGFDDEKSGSLVICMVAGAMAPILKGPCRFQIALESEYD